MPFPEAERIELPILQELQATGGSDYLRFLYDRLVVYFPQLSSDDLQKTNKAGRSRWQALVQQSGKLLVAKGELQRQHSRWTLTPRGRRRLETEEARMTPDVPAAQEAPHKITHKEA